MAMDTILDRVTLAFSRLFQDVVIGNFSDVLLSDVGIVFVILLLPIITIGTVIGGPKN